MVAFLGCAGKSDRAGDPSTTRPGPSFTHERNDAVSVVAVESVYGDIVRQIGGPSVSVTTILSNPNADPHAYEPTTADANAVGAADVVIENGLGYDAFADKLVAASPRGGRVTIVAGSLAGHALGDNPHVWYDVATLRATSHAIAAALEKRMPSRRAMLRANAGRFDAWIDGFERRERAFAGRRAGASVAITEPVFDYVLHAVGMRIATPPSFSHAIEEGNDPAPQDVATMNEILAGRRVGAFVYNRQTVEPSTTRLLETAKAANVPIVPVTETLPANERVQTWIDGELVALEAALRDATR